MTVDETCAWSGATGGRTVAAPRRAPLGFTVSAMLGGASLGVVPGPGPARQLGPARPRAAGAVSGLGRPLMPFAGAGLCTGSVMRAMFELARGAVRWPATPLRRARAWIGNPSDAAAPPEACRARAAPAWCG